MLSGWVTASHCERWNNTQAASAQSCGTAGTASQSVARVLRFERRPAGLSAAQLVADRVAPCSGMLCGRGDLADCRSVPPGWPDYVTSLSTLAAVQA